jgi:pilus assembly protein FimV
VTCITLRSWTHTLTIRTPEQLESLDDIWEQIKPADSWLTTEYEIVKKTSTLKSTLVVVGGSLVAVPATALELGDIKVHSALGQPLRASIAYALGPDEALSDTCVTLQRGRAADGLPSVDRASMIVADGVIAIAGRSPIREPLVTMRVNIRCPYTAQLTREYMMFIDPAGTAQQSEAVPPAAAPSQRQVTTPASTQPRAAVPRRVINREPITDATRYQVQPGDTLSEIVQRIENRPVGLWNVVNEIFDANPDAFLDDDPNKLKAGSWLVLPDFAAGVSPKAAVTAAADNVPVEAATAGTEYEPASIESDAQSAAEELTSSTADTNDTVSSPADLEPGDEVRDSDNPFVEPVEPANGASTVIPDTSLDGPATSSSSPNVPLAVIQPAAPAESTTTNWMLWLGGVGIAIILGMLLFGRRFKGQFGSAPVGAAALQQSHKSDTAEPERIAEAQIDIADDSPTAENLALDADLIIGTGLQEGTSVDVAKDFGFASPTNLDMELPEEMSSGGAVEDTDILPPFSADVESILDSEVLPEDHDDDMSVVVDATKMPQPDDPTENDLEAIQVDAIDEAETTGDYTVDQEVDYKILEQDYEDEMTATQALNAEIQKAADDLAACMDDDIDDETAEVPLTIVRELDMTAQLPVKDLAEEEIGDDDETSVLRTVKTDADDKTVEMTQENTVEMPKGGSKTG